MISHTTPDDDLMDIVYLLYELHVGRDNNADLSRFVSKVQHYCEVSPEQALRLLKRARKEKMASGKYFPTAEEHFHKYKRWFSNGITVANS